MFTNATNESDQVNETAKLSANAGPGADENPTPKGSRWKYKGKGRGREDKVVAVEKNTSTRVAVRDESTKGVTEMLRASLLSNYRRIDALVDIEPLTGTAEPTMAGFEKATQRLRELIAAKRTKAPRTTVEFKLYPELAEALLSFNPNNRRFSEVRAKELARDMPEHWRPSHQGMALGPDFDLGDGQHRCRAVVISGVSIPMTFTQYHDRDDFEASRKVWDIGGKRSKADVLELGKLVRKGHGRFFAAALESITHVDARWPVHPTREELVEMFHHYQASLEASAALDVREFGAPARAAFVVAHAKCPTQIEEAIRMVSAKIGYAENSALHSMVLLLPDIQRQKNARDRVGIVKDTLSLLYKHVKGHPGVTCVKNNADAYRFFLGENFREVAE